MNLTEIDCTIHLILEDVRPRAVGDRPDLEDARAIFLAGMRVASVLAEPCHTGAGAARAIRQSIWQAEGT